MINSLPHEIILQICSYLVFYDKLNLSNTCRATRGCIVATVLYEDLFIPQKHVDSLLTSFKHNTIDPSQVKVLRVAFSQEKESNFYDLPIIFPNIRQLFTGPCPTSSKKLKPKEAEDISHIRNTLRTYDTRTCHKAVLLLVNRYIFNQITELFMESAFFRSNNKFKLDIIQCISNCPSLTVLTLDKFHINLDFFERMHSSTTTLRELNLIEINIKIDETELPRNIVPYPALETLEMTCKKFIDTSLLFVNHVTEKYSNLNTLDINDWMLQARPNTPAYHSVLTYRDYHPILADRILQLVTRLNVLKVEPRLFENFFDHLGPSLSHLTGLGIYSSKDMFTMFKNMNEFNFVKSLDGLTSLSLEAKNPKFLYHKNTTLPNIRNLDIFGQVAFANRTVKLDRLLFTFNGLEKLNLTCRGAKITIGDMNNRVQYQSLLSLSIEAAGIVPDVNSYLTDCLPNMREIYWKSLKYPSNYTFNLPNHTIRLLNICTIGYVDYSYTTQRDGTKTSYDITTQHGLRPKYYAVVYPDIKKVRDEDDDTTYRKVVNVEVICRDLWKLQNGGVAIF